MHRDGFFPASNTGESTLPSRNDHLDLQRSLHRDLPEASSLRPPARMSDK